MPNLSCSPAKLTKVSIVASGKAMPWFARTRIRWTARVWPAAAAQRGAALRSIRYLADRKHARPSVYCLRTPVSCNPPPSGSCPNIATYRQSLGNAILIITKEFVRSASSSIGSDAQCRAISITHRRRPGAFMQNCQRFGPSVIFTIGLDCPKSYRLFGG